MKAIRSLVCVVLVLVVTVSFFATFDAHAEFLAEEDRVRLQEEYNKIQAEIAEWQKVLDETRAKKNTLQGDVTALNALIKKAEAEIRQRGITIKNISDDIAQKEEKINSLEEKLIRSKASLANMLRLEHQSDEQPLVAMLLSSEDFSTFFGELDQFAVLKRELEELFVEIRDVRAETEEEKKTLTQKKNEELDAQYEVTKTKKQIAMNEAEKQKLLTVTKDQEKTYSNVLAERQRKAEQIRSALFPLRDSAGISFGDALNYASQAERSTGVRAALILAILSQESDLGKNVGSCFVTNLDTGDGIGKNTGTAFQKVMKAPRDTVPFERIASTLGLLWGATPVSCPLGAKYTSARGYGGAMGPSQFIPSTWELYEKRLSQTLGISQPNPWDAGHAVMATALYMKDLGAAGGTYTAERNAACRYYSGRACDNRAPRNYTYGDSVIAKAESFQENIDFLKGI